MKRTDATTTLAELRSAALAFRDARDWAQFHRPKDLAMAIGIEAAELAELFLWRSEAVGASSDPVLRDKASEEIADVLLYLLYMADALGIDVATAVFGKMAKNEARFPVGAAQGAQELGS